MCNHWIGQPIVTVLERVAPPQSLNGSATEIAVVDSPPDAKLDIHHIDVGQGEATLVVYSKTGKTALTMLIDGGLATRGGETVHRYLRQLKVDTLDAVVCTHYDADHIGGLIRVLQHASKADSELKIVNVYERGEPSDDAHPTIRTFRKLARKMGTLFTLKQGQVIGHVSERDRSLLRIRCVSVVNGEVRDLEENNASIALLFELGNFRYYTGGDLESTGEEASVKQHVCAFKCGHHGSNHSTSSNFLKTVQASAAFVSCGHQGYGHPGEHTLERLQEADSIQNFYLTTCHYNRIGVNRNWFTDEVKVACKMVERALDNLCSAADSYSDDKTTDNWAKLAFAHLELDQIYAYWTPLAKTINKEREQFKDFGDVFQAVNSANDYLIEFESKLRAGVTLFISSHEFPSGAVHVTAEEEEEEGDIANALDDDRASRLEKYRALALATMRRLRREVRSCSGGVNQHWANWLKDAAESGKNLAIHQLDLFLTLFRRHDGLWKGLVAGDLDHLGMVVLSATLADNLHIQHQFHVGFHRADTRAWSHRRHICCETVSEVELYGFSRSPLVQLTELKGCLPDPGKADKPGTWMHAVSTERSYIRFCEPTWLRSERKHPNPLSEWEYEDQIGLHEQPEILPKKNRAFDAPPDLCLLCEKALRPTDDGYARCRECGKKYRVHYDCWRGVDKKRNWKCQLHQKP